MQQQGDAPSDLAIRHNPTGEAGATENTLGRILGDVQVPHDAAKSKTVPAAPMSRTAAAERMRAHRQRRKSGLVCVTIELRETEITELIKRALMKADTRHDVHAIRNALHRHLDESLGA